MGAVVVVLVLAVIGLCVGAVGATLRREAAARQAAGTTRRAVQAERAARQLPARYADDAIPGAVIADAARLAVTAGAVSAFDLTRQLRVTTGNGRIGITSARAALVELERRGVVSPETSSGRRLARYTADQWAEVLPRLRSAAPPPESF